VTAAVRIPTRIALKLLKTGKMQGSKTKPGTVAMRQLIPTIAVSATRTLRKNEMLRTGIVVRQGAQTVTILAKAMMML
jgi:hypothetical protein